MENSNVLFQDMMLMHVEFDQVMHYLFEIIPNNLKRGKKHIDQVFISNIFKPGCVPALIANGILFVFLITSLNVLST